MLGPVLQCAVGRHKIKFSTHNAVGIMSFPNSDIGLMYLCFDSNITHPVMYRNHHAETDEECAVTFVAFLYVDRALL